MEGANALCQWLSDWAWENQTWRQFAIHRACYHLARAKFGLAAQIVVRAEAKVSDTYKLDHRVKRTFRPHSAIAYDSRILRWKLTTSEVSIWTMTGRQTIPFVCGERQRILLQTQQGESDLAFVDGKFYLLATCNIETPEPGDVEGVLGLDLGVVNILTDSDGAVYSGAQVNGLRHRHRRLRAKLQAKGTKSARRLLKQRHQRESRFARDVNHHISKRIVAKAERTKRGIALEDLKDILARVRVRRPQRATLHSWSFAQLGSFVSYKATLAGVPVVYVDPAYTSQTCPACGHVSRSNRQSQSSFLCVRCGLAGLADAIAAMNVAVRGRVAVNRPYAAGLRA